MSLQLNGTTGVIGPVNEGSVTATGSTTARNLDDRFADVVNVKDFLCSDGLPVAGDGVHDDTTGIQVAINYASSINGEVFIPSGNYLFSAQAAGTSGYEVAVFVPANVKIYGKGRIFCNRGALPYLTLFAIKGSNVSIDGITFDNEFNNTGTASQRSNAIGAGNRNFANDEAIVTNISITNCTFLNQFYATNFVTDTISPNILQKIYCAGNKIVASDNGIFSGAFNFRDDSMSGSIKDLIIVGNDSRGATNAGGINIYGVNGFSVTNNICSDCDYSGIQCENNCQNGTISGNYVDRASRGIWIDDSSDIVIQGNTVIAEQRIPPEGTASYRDGILITRQGFTSQPNYLTTNIVISNNAVFDGRIRSSTFGSSPAGEFGDFIISDNIVKFRDSSNQQANGISLGSCSSIQINSNTVIGGTSDSIIMSLQDGQYANISDNITQKAGTESSYGLYIVGSSLANVVRVGNNFLQGIRGTVSTKIRGLEYLGTDGSRMQFQNISIEAGIGSPEGNIAAGPGSLYADKTDFSAKLYIKTGGFGNTGWTQIT
jgi:parallel beta-helix repeat protein